ARRDLPSFPTRRSSDLENGQVSPAVKPALVSLYAALDTPAPADLEPLRQLLHDPTALGAPPLPNDLTATLRPYQAQGVRWLNVRSEEHTSELQSRENLV